MTCRAGMQDRPGSVYGILSHFGFRNMIEESAGSHAFLVWHAD